MIDNTKPVQNSLLVILDTENEQHIRIGKIDGTPPANAEEMKDMVLLDIATLCEALVVSIRTADAMGIKPEGESMKDAIDQINQAFVDPNLHCFSPQFPGK
jgi:hypothetical protein